MTEAIERCPRCYQRFQRGDRFCANCGQERPAPRRNYWGTPLSSPPVMHQPVTPTTATVHPEHPAVVRSRRFWRTTVGGWVALVLLLGLAVFAVVALRGASKPAAPHTLRGRVWIGASSHYDRVGTSCQGSGAYAQVNTGALVFIHAPGDVAPARTALNPGHISQGLNCEFTFTATVPDADSYEIAVAGQAPFSTDRASLERADWTAVHFLD